MILHLNTAHTWRGGEQQLFYLALGLQKQKFRQLVVGQPGSELEKKCLASAVPFQPVPIKSELDLKAVSLLGEIMQQNSVKIIHTHTARAHSIGLLLKWKHPGAFLVVSRRVDFHINKNFLSKLKYTSSLNDIFLTVSRKIRDILIADGVSSDKIMTVHSGIDLKRFSRLASAAALKKEFQIKDNEIIIGNIAALVDHKDQRSLIQAVAKMKTKIPFRLFILGEGELENELKALVQGLHLEDKIVFTGFRTEITAFLNLFDIFALTSKEEGLGTTVLDAMASGLPVVATRGGGIPEMLIDGDGAYLTDVADSDSIAAALDSLAGDKKLREKFGQSNKEYVKRFSVEETVRKTIFVYQSFLNRRNK